MGKTSFLMTMMMLHALSPLLVMLLLQACYPHLWRLLLVLLMCQQDPLIVVSAIGFHP